MLVEDDNNLRAIYGDRLMAEGYDIVSARDGEEALAMAVKEKPNLIISDVMMPKISGFDMLDILRTTPETKDVKVIMMTALSQAEDKERADKLGADKYLVKSQVTLEDVARVVHEVLGDNAEQATPVTEVEGSQSASAPDNSPANTPDPSAQPIATTPAPQPQVASVSEAPANPFEAPVTESPAAVETTVAPANPFEAPAPSTAVQEPVLTQPEPAITSTSPVQVSDATTQSVPPAATPVAVPDPTPAPAGPVADIPTTDTTAAPQVPNDSVGSPDPTGSSKRVIQPINDLSADAQPKIYELYEKEMADQAKMAPVGSPEASTVIAPPPTPEEQTATTPGQTPSAPGAVFDPNSVAL